MGYDEERFLILNMLEQGKISTQEAFKLLEALEVGNENVKKDEQKKSTSNRDIFNNLQELGDRIEEHVSSIVESIDGKISSAKQKMDSSSDSKGGTSLLDRILEKIDFSLGDDYYTTKKSFSYTSEDFENAKLSFEAINGKITIGTHDQQNLLVEATIKSKKEISGEVLDFKQDNEGLSLRPLVKDSIVVSYVITLPSTAIGELYAKTSNSTIALSEASIKACSLLTSNSKIEAVNCSLHALEALTSNSKISFRDCKAHTATAKTSNGRIQLINCSAKDVNLKTSNGSIDVEGIRILGNVKTTLVTSNGKINFDAQGNDIGYDITADTSHGNINIDLSNVNFSNNLHNKHFSKHIKAQSSDFNHHQNTIVLEAYTSNGSINIR